MLRNVLKAEVEIRRKTRKKEAEEQVGRRILYYMRCRGNNSKHKIDEKGKRV